MPLLSSKKTAALLGVHPNTLRNWARDGKIRFERTPSGQRRYDPTTVLSNGDSSGACVGARICYCRVSSAKQRDDLNRQIGQMRENFPAYELIQDVGSGLNFKRCGLLSILERAMSGAVKEVVVAHKDRLCRFGFDLIQWIVEKNGGRIVVLNDTSVSPQHELITDILSILHVFSCRMHGLRKYSKSIKEDQAISDNPAESGATADPGDISLHI